MSVGSERVSPIARYLVNSPERVRLARVTSYAVTCIATQLLSISAHLTSMRLVPDLVRVMLAKFLSVTVKDSPPLTLISYVLHPSAGSQ